MKTFDADAVAALGPAAAVAAITEALRGGLDPSAGTARSFVPLTRGELLLMPAESTGAVGIKLATVAPDNAAHGLPRIHATYVLFDSETLVPTALLEGTALTTLRTPAVSVAAVLPALPDRPLRVVVFGTGPQGVGHVATLAAVRPLADVTYVGRSGAADEVLRQADVVVCATTAREPLFDSSLLRDDVVVIAVGSHEPEARELDAALLGRSTVVVEDVATALREAGDVIQAIEEGDLEADRLVPMRDVVTGTVVPELPLVFKSVGMAWQDLVVAEAVVGRGPSVE